MKRLRLKCFDCSMFFYSEDEKARFEKDYRVVVGDNIGLTSGNGVWIGDHHDIVGVCYHEAVHLVDWLLRDRLEEKGLGLEDSHEIRAYLTEYIGSELRKYITGA